MHHLPEGVSPQNLLQAGELARDRKTSRPVLRLVSFRCAGARGVCDSQRDHGSDVPFDPADSKTRKESLTAHSSAVSSFDSSVSFCVKAAVGWDHEEPMAAAAETRCSCA